MKFSNREMVMAINKLIEEKVKDGYFLLNFKRNNKGFQGLLKLPFKKAEDLLVFYLEREVEELEDLRDEDYLALLVKQFKDNQLLESLEKLFHPVKTHILIFESILSKDKNKIIIYKTSFYNLLSMLNFMRYGIRFNAKMVKRWKIIIETYNVYNEVIKNKVLSDVLRIIVEP